MSGLDTLMKSHEENGKNKKRWAKACERQDLEEINGNLSVSQIQNKLKPHIKWQKVYGIAHIVRIEKDLLELRYKNVVRVLHSDDIKRLNLKTVCDSMVVQSFYATNSAKEIPELKEISKKLLNKMNKIRNSADYNYVNGISELKQYSEIMMSVKNLNHQIQNLPMR